MNGRNKRYEKKESGQQETKLSFFIGFQQRIYSGGNDNVALSISPPLCLERNLSLKTASMLPEHHLSLEIRYKWNTDKNHKK